MSIYVLGDISLLNLRFPRIVGQYSEHTNGYLQSFLPRFLNLSGYGCGLEGFIWMAKNLVCGPLDDTSSLG